MIDNYHRSCNPPDSIASSVDEVCRCVLDPTSLAYVATNAPSEIANRYGAKQRKLARLSLQVASRRIVRELTCGQWLAEHDLALLHLQPWMSKARCSFALTACTLGRFALGILAGLRHGIPPKLQLSISNRILTSVSKFLVEGDLGVEFSPNGQPGGVGAPHLPDATQWNKLPRLVAGDILRTLQISLPSDLSRLIFLATLRDNNSGHYYHPDVARRFSAEVASLAMLECHRQVYECVVSLSLEDLTEQLDAYLATVRAPRARLIESWTKLQAYRATIPIDTDPISAEIFFMKVEVAIAILEARLPGRIQ